MHQEYVKKWSHIINEQIKSGLSVSDWCSQNDVNYKTFYNNRKKLSKLTKPNSQILKSESFQKFDYDINNNEKISVNVGCFVVEFSNSVSPLKLKQYLKAIKEVVC